MLLGGGLAFVGCEGQASKPVPKAGGSGAAGSKSNARKVAPKDNLPAVTSELYGLGAELWGSGPTGSRAATRAAADAQARVRPLPGPAAQDRQPQDDHHHPSSNHGAQRFSPAVAAQSPTSPKAARLERRDHVEREATVQTGALALAPGYFSEAARAPRPLGCFGVGVWLDAGRQRDLLELVLEPSDPGLQLGHANPQLTSLVVVAATRRHRG